MAHMERIGCCQKWKSRMSSLSNLLGACAEPFAIPIAVHAHFPCESGFRERRMQV